MKRLRKISTLTKSQYDYVLLNCLFTDEQLTVLSLSLRGNSRQQIAYSMNCSIETVRNRRREIIDKINEVI